MIETISFIQFTNTKMRIYLLLPTICTSLFLARNKKDAYKNNWTKLYKQVYLLV